MIEWLRRDPADLSITLGGTNLPLDIRRHPTAKRMVLRLADDGASVRVTLPRWGRTDEAIAFAESRAEWLAAQLAKRPAATAIEPGAVLPFHGRDLRIEWDSGRPRKPVVDGDRIHVCGPKETLQSRLKRWLQSQAREAFATDLQYYSQVAQLPTPDYSISSARRRWGSCSSSGTVRINWRLIMAPDNVRRSVVAHETAHRVHFDHSPAFYSLLSELYEGDLALADGWLKQHGRTLYAFFG
ncbi:M48 family metallopeptidase [Erythrobacter litoralis]|uniref:YgjP-like metallopeptidase domain-containing protein n=1 Tax=Erythrobacter litoralis (strain HTCC2594) TaxID=314225 RepID=Q2NDW7_ERYLH|nr:SprT family zinc-dependent metalloprotease [Erythrobacter litoralis]ABC62124.1 hypothetical protein ELI_00160 [Erythrobacter litoralis HTCC2594]